MLERKEPEIGEVRNGLAGGVDAKDPAGVPDVSSGGIRRKHQPPVSQSDTALGDPWPERDRSPKIPEMRKRLTFGITIVLVLSACSWTQFRGNARRSGVNPYAPGVTAATLNSLTPAWTSANHGAQLDDVITRDGLAVFGGTTALWAVDLGTGGDAWHADHARPHKQRDRGGDHLARETIEPSSR